MAVAKLTLSFKVDPEYLRYIQAMALLDHIYEEAGEEQFNGFAETVRDMIADVKESWGDGWMKIDGEWKNNGAGDDNV